MNQTHFHRRNLPHYYRSNSTYFITFRLKGTIPLKTLKQLVQKYNIDMVSKTKEEKYHSDKLFFAEYDRLLDNNFKIQHLRNEKIAKEVEYCLHYPDKIKYKLICYTIMPNHVHLVFHLLEETHVQKAAPQTIMSVKNKPNKNNLVIHHSISIDKIMKSIKGISARKINKILNRRGSFWQSESYDHIVRNEDELTRILKYVTMNPVKAGLVKKWEDWKFTYLMEDWL